MNRCNSRFCSISDLIIGINKIESFLLDINQENIDEIQKTILSSIFVSSRNYYYILLFSLNFIMQSRPLKLNLYKKLLLSLKQDFTIKNFFPDENDIIKIFMHNELALFHIGIDKKNYYIVEIDHHSLVYPVPGRYTPRDLSDNLFEKFIREDDVENFQILTSKTNKDLRSYVTCPSVNPMGYFTNINLNNIEFISYSAFYGSLQIFKFLWMKLNSMNKNEFNKSQEESNNINKIPKDLAIFAIAGGNYEIIHILDEFVRKDRFSLVAAIRFFQFELIDYLIETCGFEVGIDEIIASIHCHNFKFFFDHCQNFFTSCYNKEDFIPVILFSSYCSNAVALNYIDDVLHFDITQTTEKSSILFESVFNENLNILSFIFFDNVFNLDYNKESSLKYHKRPIFDINQSLSEYQGFSGLNLLHLVTSNKLFRVAKFFLSDEFRFEHRIPINWNIKDCTGATPLHWSILFQNFEMFHLLISHSNFAANQKDQNQNELVDAYAVNDLNQNILHMACNNISDEIINYILQNEIIDPKLEDNFKENVIHYAARNGICYIFDFPCIKRLPKDIMNKKNYFKPIIKLAGISILFINL